LKTADDRPSFHQRQFARSLERARHGIQLYDPGEHFNLIAAYPAPAAERAGGSPDLGNRRPGAFRDAGIRL
jgi:hypothetical protein